MSGAPRRVLILADDLIWAERLMRLVAEIEATPVRVRTEVELEAAMPEADAIIVDLTALAYDPVRAVQRAALAGRPLLAIGRHDDPDLRKQALTAGAERVLAYRKIFEDGPATLRSWLDRESPAKVRAS